MIKVRGDHLWWETNGGEACSRCKIARGSYKAMDRRMKAFYDIECRNRAAGMLYPASINERRSKARKNKPDQLRIDI